jgi:hypothetical protein
MHTSAALIAGRLTMALVAVLAVSCGYAGTSASGQKATQLQMSRVTVRQLEQAHLTLYPPNGSGPISRATAERVAESLYHADSVLESVLAIVDNSNLQNLHDNSGGTPGLHRLAWVVALPAKFASPLYGPDPDPGQSPAPAVQPTYLVVVIDAQTGKPIYDSMGVA